MSDEVHAVLDYYVNAGGLSLKELNECVTGIVAAISSTCQCVPSVVTASPVTTNHTHKLCIEFDAVDRATALVCKKACDAAFEALSAFISQTTGTSLAPIRGLSAAMELSPKDAVLDRPLSHDTATAAVVQRRPRSKGPAPALLTGTTTF